MIIDLALFLLIVLAILKGVQRGLVMALVSFVGGIVALAAALKLSAVVAGWLGGGDARAKGSWWLPFLSFLIVMIGMMLLIRWVGTLISAGVKMVMLGWANRLLGVILYAVIYTTGLSVLLFFAVQLHLIKPETLAASTCYPFIKPWGPKFISVLSELLPFLKGLFGQLEAFFGGLASRA